MRKTVCFMAMLTLAFVSVLFAQKVDKEGKAWLTQNTAPAEVNVNGIWQSPEWGEINLIQAQGSNEVTGDGDGWKIDGLVSGKKVFLLFSDKGRVNYSAVLTAESDSRLVGGYARALIEEKTKTKNMLLTK